MSKLKNYVKSVIVWNLMAILVGVATGIAGGLFHKVIEFATHTRIKYDWFIYLLPVGGVIITFLYSFSKTPLTTNAVFESVRMRKNVSPLLAPFIFVSAFITHLLGGSAGREGAALQLGGSIASQIGKCFKLKKENMSTIIICGMSGAFSAIFTTPVTAAIFAYEVVSVGKSRYYELLPALISAVFGYVVTVLMGNEVLAYRIVSLPANDLVMLGKVVIIAVMVAVVSILFCVSIKTCEYYGEKIFTNPYIRTVVGSVILILLTLLVGIRDYNGAGMNVIEDALKGNVKYEAFILKLIFTVVTITAGFKGGEIVPAFFIGATLGATLSVVLGIDMAVAAALGMCAMFCGITNCPVASILLGAELFGSGNLLYFALVCAVSYVSSGYFGLYKSQKIVYSKTEAEKINIFTR